MTTRASHFKMLRYHVRMLLGLHRARRLPDAGLKPRIGAYVVRDDVRMTVQAGLGDDLWNWLLDQGWREPAYRPDRRRYREIPASWVTRLIDSEPQERAGVLDAAISAAKIRPTIGRSRAMPTHAARASTR